MDFAIETYNLTKIFKTKLFSTHRFYSEAHPSVFFTEVIRSLTGIGVHKQVIRAVDDVNIKVGRSELFGLIGPNGSGKTTLLRLLSTFIGPTSGSASIMGYDLIRDRDKILKVVNHVAGVLTGGVWSRGEVTARENLRFFAEFFRIGNVDIDSVLDSVGLKEYADVRVATFSSGMYARLAVAAALLKEAPIYLMDEPTAGFSIDAIRAFHEHLKNHLVKERGATVVYATHNVYEAEEYFDKVAIMDKGKVIAVDAPRSLIKSLGEVEGIDIEASYVGEAAAARIEGLEGVIEARFNLSEGGGFIKILCHDARSILPEAISILVRDGARVKYVKVREPNLEDVFMKLIGKGKG